MAAGWCREATNYMHNHTFIQIWVTPGLFSHHCHSIGSQQLLGAHGCDVSHVGKHVNEGDHRDGDEDCTWQIPAGWKMRLLFWLELVQECPFLKMWLQEVCVTCKGRPTLPWRSLGNSSLHKQKSLAGMTELWDQHHSLGMFRKHALAPTSNSDLWSKKIII